METTKTGKLQRIVLPKDIVDIRAGTFASYQKDQCGNRSCSSRVTFQDLARVAEVRDIVTRSISGLAKFREAARLDGDSDPSGEISGEVTAETETAVGA